MLETNELNQAAMITILKNKSLNKNSIARTISPRYFTISATFAMTKLKEMPGRFRLVIITIIATFANLCNN